MKLRSAFFAALMAILMAPAQSCPCGNASSDGTVPGAETFYYCDYGSPM